MLWLHDTATGSLTEVAMKASGELSLYVCGPTVDGPPHLGHGRSMLVYDVLRRYLEYRGISVRHVSNITDVDDKIINRAHSQGMSVTEVAEQYEAKWWESADALGVLRPTQAPKATEYIEQMVRLIEELVRTEKAYSTPMGVYLDTSTVADYGLLAHQDLSSLRAGERVEPNPDKRCEVDFVLWKPAKPNEPSWPSPWGRGRPGWHTECVIMSLDLLGDGFDLHAGGMDLAFPHHENERAQAQAWGRPFARHWMHHAFITTGGEKMSKSLGNFTALPDLLSATDPRAYRLLVLQSHYRQPLEVTRETLGHATEALSRLDALSRRLLEPRNGDGTSTETGTSTEIRSTPAQQVIRERFCAAMNRDLDTPGATAVLFEAVRDANTAADEGRIADAFDLASVIEECFASVGLLLSRLFEPIPLEIESMIGRRQAARVAKDFALADSLRDQLASLGWTVEDGADGPRARRS